MAEKAAETKEAVAEVTAETVAEEMAENITNQGDWDSHREVGRDRGGGQEEWALKSYNGLKWD